MVLVAREAITPTNKSPIFCIVTWVLEATVLLAVAVKVGLLRSSVGLHSDDWCILAAAILSIGQVVAVSVQGVTGIGRLQSTLSSYSLTVYQKSGYAAEILYVLTFTASKLAVVFFIYHLTDFGLHRRVAASIGIFIALWSVAYVFVVAFQCRVPNEWAIIQGQCINQVDFLTAYESINIATELAIIVLPLVMIAKLRKLAFSKKIILGGSFSLRVVVVAGVAMQIYHLHHPASPSSISYDPHFNPEDDKTFSAWRFYLAGQVSQSLSIITTCIPFLKNLLLGMQTGMIQTGHVSARHISNAGRRGSSRQGSRSVMGWHGSSNTIPSDGRNPSVDSTMGNNTVYRAMAEYSMTTNATRNPSISSTGSGGPHVTWRTGPRPSRGDIPREVSMIAEEEEEDHRRERIPEIAHIHDGAQNPYAPNVQIPTRHISFPDRHG